MPPLRLRHVQPRSTARAAAAVGLLTASGPGVERLAEELGEILPKARLAVMTSDTAGDAKAATALVEAMESHTVDILVGTQIIAKGHHFPDLTLVGVVDADLGLGGGDLRAAERTFQLLYQVAGRAGREERPGRVLIQTHLPEHPVMQALAVGDKDRFLAVELEERRLGEMPPFGRLAALIVAGGDAERVKAEARRIAQAAPESDAALVLGPAPAPSGAAARPLPRAAPGQGGTRAGPARLAARVAEAVEAAGRRPAAGRRRPDQLPVSRCAASGVSGSSRSSASIRRSLAGWVDRKAGGRSPLSSASIRRQNSTDCAGS